MKIGFDAKRAFLNATGLGSYSRTLLRALYDEFPGHQYFLYTPKQMPREDLAFVGNNQRVVVREPAGLLGRAWPSFWRSFLLSNDIRKDGLDLYHGLSHELPRGIEKTRVKSIVTIHDLIFLRYPSLYPVIDRQIYEIKFRHACRVADHIIAVSEETRKNIMHFFGVSPEKIRVIYQCCDEPFMKPVPPPHRDAVQAKYNLPQQYVLSVGSITERKNLLTIVQALHRLKDRLDAFLVVVGKGGAYRKKVARYVADNGLQERVLFLGAVPSEDLPALYQMADLFVYPSLFEGFGIPVIEALWSGTPVITSRGSCFAESGGPDSIYVDPLNAEALSAQMERVLVNNTLRNRMSKAGKNYVTRFSPAAVSQETMKLYEKLLNSVSC